jgi:DNA-binding PadR family transcriptional regulator
MADPVDREIRLGFWKVHILHHAQKQPVYGRWMLEELAEHGHHLSPGTLYPILARMEANGWLRSHSAGPRNARRSYRITAEGRRVLDDLRAEIGELHAEVVMGKEPRGSKRSVEKNRETRAASRRKGARTHGR